MLPHRRELLTLVAFSAVFAAPVAARAQSAPPARRDVPFVPTPPAVIPVMLDLADVKPDDILYDLGCGDGRIVIAAAKQRSARGIGVELSPLLIEKCNENAIKAGVTDKVQFLQQDLFLCDFADATVVMLYLMPTINIKLRPKLFQELKPGTRVVSHNFDMGDWEPDRKILLRQEGRWLFLWIMPAYVEGIWDANLQGPSGQTQHARLQLRQRYQKVTGSAEIDGRRYDLIDGRMRGQDLTFGLRTGGDLRKPPVQYTCRMVSQPHVGQSEPDPSPTTQSAAVAK